MEKHIKRMVWTPKEEAKGYAIPQNSYMTGKASVDNNIFSKGVYSWAFNYTTVRKLEQTF